MKDCKHIQTIKIEEEELNNPTPVRAVISCCLCGKEINENEEIRKMTYDPTNGKEGEDKKLLPKDTILSGVITKIEDGKLPDFVEERYLKSWQGNTDSPAINVSIEVQNGEEKVTITNLFTYMDEDGKTVYTPKSNLGKYVKKYGKLPVTGDQVKVISNSDGFGKVKLD